jgi:ABC-type lipoprotein export system ATPase subunit
MLEVKNLVKNYATTGKNAVYVRALNGISLKFPDTGLIFILGKSGSGKSTLLNVMGGLDTVDSGEIIIKGKSSAKFKSSDFDSYRNTYLGFIFQEYNILDEFTVEKNISLALELQGKKHKKADIDEILKEVDLEGLNDRKPNELSGGQKQRVAIARALVKHPDIIFADEPTGALDSATGKVVFDTLKKLSTNHLVVVVSHDRDFAEQFGDRVIELKDGKVISDIEKQVVGSTSNSGLNIIDDKIIQIKKGYKLTEADKKRLIEKIEESEDEKIIVMDDQISPQVKKISNINSTGNHEKFEKTDESKIKNKEEKFKLIKSKLGFKNSFKIGASALKVKPFRLFLTMLLALLSFTALGLVDCMSSYDKTVATTDSIIDSKMDYLSLSKTVCSRTSHNSDSVYNFYSDSEVAKFSEDYDCEFNGLISGYKAQVYFHDNFLSTTGIGRYYKLGIDQTNYSFSDIDDNFLKKNNFSLISGELPDEDYEIGITDYQLQIFNKTGYSKDKTNVDAIKAGEITKDNIIGKELFFNPNYAKITCVIDTGFASNASLQSEYFPLKDVEQTNNQKYDLLYTKLSSYIRNSYIDTYFLSSDFFGSFLNTKTTQTVGGIHGQCRYYFESSGKDSNIYKILNSSYPGMNIKFLKEKTFVTVNEDICFPYYEFKSFLQNEFTTLQNKFKNVTIPDSDNKACITYYDEKESKIFSFKDVYSDNNLCLSVLGNRHKQEILNNGFNVEYINKLMNEEIYTADADGNFLNDKDFLSAFVKNCITYRNDGTEGNTFINGIDFNRLIDSEGPQIYILFEYSNNDVKLPDLNITIIANKMLDNGQLGPDVEYKRTIAGICTYGDLTNSIFSINKDDDLASMLITNDSSLDSVPKYTRIIAKTPTSRNKIAKLAKLHTENIDNINNYNDSDITKTIGYSILSGTVFDALNTVNSVFSILNKIFFYLGLILMLFTCLLLFNFIGTSISYKRREIGILRAVGARGKDVFGIFMSESLIIVWIDIIASCIATFGICIYLNYYLRNLMNIPITVLHAGLRQILVIAGIGIITAFISTFIPVIKTSNKKPIDAIHDK